MRTNGDGERPQASTAERAAGDDEREREEAGTAANGAAKGAAKGPKSSSKSHAPKSMGPKSVRSKSMGPKSVRSKSVAPKSIEPTTASVTASELAEGASAGDKLATKSPARARKSIIPKSRSTSAFIAAPAAHPAKESTAESSPPSLHPRTTLRDHPVQKKVAGAARAAVAERDDEISIPPTSGEPPTDLDDRFFAEGEAAARAAHAEALRLHPAKVIITADPLHGDHADARPLLVLPERRKKLTNYVKLAVGFSAVLLLAGFVSRMTHPNGGTGGERSAAAAQLQAVALQAVPVAAPVPPPPTEAVVPPPPPEEELAVPVDPAPPAKSAKEEKEDARAALEHGKRKDAVDSAQRSIDLEPTDAEAWLILGSAQQDLGHWKEARESFVACTKQAKVGPIEECRMMLR
jgi:hypothetical protein